jgi:hypothetical protein
MTPLEQALATAKPAYKDSVHGFEDDTYTLGVIVNNKPFTVTGMANPDYFCPDYGHLLSKYITAKLFDGYKSGHVSECGETNLPLAVEFAKYHESVREVQGAYSAERDLLLGYQDVLSVLTGTFTKLLKTMENTPMTDPQKTEKTTTVTEDKPHRTGILAQQVKKSIPYYVKHLVQLRDGSIWGYNLPPVCRVIDSAWKPNPKDVYTPLCLRSAVIQAPKWRKSLEAVTPDKEDKVTLDQVRERFKPYVLLKDGTEQEIMLTSVNMSETYPITGHFKNPPRTELFKNMGHCNIVLYWNLDGTYSDTKHELDLIPISKSFLFDIQ